MNLSLPFPPSTNTYYRNMKGRMVMSQKGRDYKTTVTCHAIRQHGEYTPITGRVALSVNLYPPDRRRRDIDNFAGKALLDALTAARVWDDDSQVKKLFVEMHAPEKGGRCEVVITEMGSIA